MVMFLDRFVVVLHTSHKNVFANLYLHARLNLIFPSLIRFRLNICLALSMNKIIRLIIYFQVYIVDTI